MVIALYQLTKAVLAAYLSVKSVVSRKNDTMEILVGKILPFLRELRPHQQVTQPRPSAQMLPESIVGGALAQSSFSNQASAHNDSHQGIKQKPLSFVFPSTLSTQQPFSTASTTRGVSSTEAGPSAYFPPGYASSGQQRPPKSPRRVSGAHFSFGVSQSGFQTGDVSPSDLSGGGFHDVSRSGVFSSIPSGGGFGFMTNPSSDSGGSHTPFSEGFLSPVRF